MPLRPAQGIALGLCGETILERQENIASLRLRVGFAFFVNELLLKKLLLKENHQQHPNGNGGIGDTKHGAEKIYTHCSKKEKLSIIIPTTFLWEFYISILGFRGTSFLNHKFS